LGFPLSHFLLTPLRPQFDAHFAHHRFRESVHIGFRFFVAECVQRRAKAMAEEPAKRIPDWLEFDLLVIVVSLAF